MKQKEKEKWERTRSKGIGRFVLLYGIVGFGGLMITAHSVSEYLIFSKRFDGLLFTYRVGLGLLCGLIWGLVMWSVGERRYRKSLRVKR